LGKSIPAATDTLYERHRERDTKPSLDEFRDILNSAVTAYSRVYFIIDALDECPEENRNVLLKYLATIGPTVNLMFTSRPHIALDPFVPQVLEIRATEEDIRRYIDSRIINSPRLSKHVQKCAELRKEIQSTLLSNVDGM